jgi:hypothetical protein
LRIRRSVARAAAPSLTSPPVTALTRRRLLATGGAAGAAAMIGFQPWSPATAVAAPASDVPMYLRRSAYLTPSTVEFIASGEGHVSTLTLTGIRDLPGDPKLVGSEDAFALEFSGPSALQGGIDTFTHPDLGNFELFVSPVDAGGTAYEVVVNRSVGVPRHVPTQPSSGAKPAPATQAHPDQHKHKVPRVRRVSARRLARTIVCELTLADGVHVRKAAVWLAHRDRVVAAAAVSHVHGRRIGLRLPFRHRPPGGHYVVTVSTTDTHGKTEMQTVRVTVA